MYAYMKYCQTEIKVCQRLGEQIFRSKCPVYDCNNEQLCTWHHYGCPTYSKVFLSDSGIIRCENCGMQEEFFSIRFDCGKHYGEHESLRFRKATNLKKVLVVIGALEDDEIYSPDFVEKLAGSLIKQYHRNKYNKDKKFRNNNENKPNHQSRIKNYEYDEDFENIDYK